MNPDTTPAPEAPDADPCTYAMTDAERADALAEWVASRPPAVRALIERFPMGSRFLIGGTQYHLVGYGEAEDGRATLQVSVTDPAVDWEAAVATRLDVCPEHFTRCKDLWPAGSADLGDAVTRAGSLCAEMGMMRLPPLPVVDADGAEYGSLREWADADRARRVVRPARTLSQAAAVIFAASGPMPHMRVEHSGHPRHGRNVPVTPRPPRVGRNDACPCLSGKKFKQCCLRGKE